MKTSETKDKGILKKELLINKDDLPMTIVYKGRRYILILTKLVPKGFNSGNDNPPFISPLIKGGLRGVTD
jgi:hypothetical protein